MRRANMTSPASSWESSSAAIERAAHQRLLPGAQAGLRRRAPQARYIRRRDPQQNRRRAFEAASLLLADAETSGGARLADGHGPHHRRRHSRQSPARAAAQCSRRHRTRLVARASDLSLPCANRENRNRRNAQDLQHGRGDDLGRSAKEREKSRGRNEAPPRAIFPHWTNRSRSGGQGSRHVFRHAEHSVGSTWQIKNSRVVPASEIVRMLQTTEGAQPARRKMYFPPPADFVRAIRSGMRSGPRSSQW